VGWKYLLAYALAHVGDEEVAGRAVEAEPPGVAQPAGPDLRPGGRLACERVVGRNRVWQGVHADAQDLPEQRTQVLGVVLGIAPRAAVAEGDVEVPVGTERDLPPAVVAEGWSRTRTTVREAGFARFSFPDTWYRATTVSPAVSV
jgi:hypothetical protein